MPRSILQPTETYIMIRRVHDRELIGTGTDKRFVRRDDQGRFKESADVGRSLQHDVKAHAKARSGQGDRGDRNGTI
jgi:hypothetical protein